MKFINKSNNSIYAKDINRHFLYNNKIYEVNEDELLRSSGLQQMVLLDQIEVVEFGNSRIEQNLQRLKDKMAKIKLITKSVKEKEDIDIVNTEKKQVIIKGHFLEGGGYAKCNRNLAIGLKNRGIDVKINIIGGNKSELTEEEVKVIAPMKGYGNKSSITIDSIVPTFSQISPGRHPILFTTVEANTIPKQFVDIANNYREIWVTSDFCKQVLDKYPIQRPISVVPNSIDTNIYDPDGEEYHFYPELKDFVFLSVFGWSYRKGWDVLLRAFLEEFNSSDPVSLLIVSKAQGGSELIKREINKYIKEYGGNNPPHIVRCSKSIPENQMPSLYRACDAFVLFSRGEGFGLPFCESSLCGLPVISTNWSGQTMFLNHDNSYLIEIDRLEKIKEGTMHVHYWDGQEFPVLKSDKVIHDARDKMRQVFDNYEEAIQKNKKLRSHIMSNYSIDSITDIVEHKLDAIWS